MALTYHAGRRIQGLSTDEPPASIVSDNFSSSTGWTLGSGFTISGGTFNISKTSGYLDGTRGTFDLGSNLSSTFVMRFKCNFSTLTLPDTSDYTLWIGVSNTTSANSTATDGYFVGVNLRNSSGIQEKKIVARVADNDQFNAGDYVSSYLNPIYVNTNYYCEIIKTGVNGNFTFNVYSDSAYTTNIHSTTATSAKNPTGLRYLWIGLEDYQAQRGSITWVGIVDDFIIYNGMTSVNGIKPTNVQIGSRLEETDTRKIYYGGLPSSELSTTGLKAYWKMNEASGTLVNSSPSADTLGTSANSSSTANLTYAQTGKIGNAISFNGTLSSSKVVIGSSLSQFNFMHNTTALWSFNCWYKKTAIDTNFRTILANHWGGAQAGVRLAFNGSLGVQFVFQNTSGNYFLLDTTTGFLPNNTNYNMLTVTYDQSLASNNLKVYSNGSLDHSVSKNGTTPSDSNSSISMGIGDDQGGDGNMYGLLDELSIWNRILTQSEITSLYNSGNGASMGWTQEA